MEAIAGPISLRQIFLDRRNWLRFWAYYILTLRWSIVYNVARMLACQTGRLGWHSYRCSQCGLTVRVRHTCKSRFCSRCGVLAADRWVERTLSKLLPVDYQHLVFSVPFDLRPWLAANRQVGLDILFGAVKDTLLDFAKSAGYRPGIVLVLHTFGSDLKWHPHIHVLITAGGLSLDNSRWLNRCFLPQKAIRPMFRHRLLTALRKASEANLLKAPPKQKFLRAPAAFSSWLSQFFTREFYVHFSRTLENPRRTVGYVGRYGRRPVIAEHRILAYDGKTVTFRYKDYLTGNLAATMQLPTSEFIARLVRHIPDANFRILRYAGIFSTRVRTKLLAIARQRLSAPQPTPPPQPVPWHLRRLRSTGSDPLVCPRCHVALAFAGFSFPPVSLRASLASFDVRAYLQNNPPLRA
jgi:hypothetical protein